MNMNRSLMVAVGASDKTVLRGAQKIARLQHVTDAKDQCPMWPVTCTFPRKPGSQWLAVGGTRQLTRRRLRQLGKIITIIAFQEELRGGVSRLFFLAPHFRQTRPAQQLARMSDGNRVRNPTWFLQHALFRFLNEDLVDDAYHHSCRGVVQRTAGISRVCGGVQLEHVVIGAQPPLQRWRELIGGVERRHNRGYGSEQAVMSGGIQAQNRAER